MAPAPSLQEVIHLVEAEADDTSPLVRLRAASSLVRNLTEVGDAALGYFVDQARHAGHSWSEIGEALGVSKQAAQQKHTVRLSADVAPSFERFTPRARSVVDAADAVSRAWGHSYIGTEHLLLALYCEPEGIAAQILVETGLSEDRVAAAVGERITRGPGAPAGKLPWTPKAKAVFSGALASALEMGHNYIGTEHLLLGLDRMDGLAKEVLEQSGLTSEILGERVSNKLARYVQARQPRKGKTTKAQSPPTKRASRSRKATK
jgi:hypothetical protein